MREAHTQPLRNRTAVDLSQRRGGTKVGLGGGAAQPSISDDGAVIEPIAPPTVAPSTSAQADALSALVNLGYAPGEAAAAIAETAGIIESGDEATLIREALKRLAPKA